MFLSRASSGDSGITSGNSSKGRRRGELLRRLVGVLCAGALLRLGIQEAVNVSLRF
jgi:hypothetical protein